MAGAPEEPARCGKCFLLVNSSHKISLNVWHLSIHFFISFLAFLSPFFNCRLHETGKRRAPNEHGSNTGAWERAGKTAEGSAQRETSGSERVKVPWLQAQGVVPRRPM